MIYTEIHSAHLIHHTQRERERDSERQRQRDVERDVVLPHIIVLNRMTIRDAVCETEQ